MAIFERGRSRFAARRIARTRGIFGMSSLFRPTKPVAPPPVKPVKKDTSIFAKGPLQPRRHEFEFVEHGIYITPDRDRRRVPKEERKRMAARLKAPKYGPVEFKSLRGPQDYQNLIKYLEKKEMPEARRQGDWRKEKQLKYDIKYYKLMGGLK